MSMVLIESASNPTNQIISDEACSPLLGLDVANQGGNHHKPGDLAASGSEVDRSPNQAEEPLEGLTTAQLMARQAPRAWLLPGMLARHEAAVILGPSKCMKTSLAVDLCGALASGGKFLGQFAAERAFRVGFVGGEGAEQVVTDLAPRWSTAAQVDLSTLDRLVWGLNMAELGDPVNLRRLTAWIERHQLEVVLIDAADFSTATPRAQARQLRELVRCCLEAGATPILCCPTRKELPPRALSAADLASAACHAVARQWLLVNRRQAFEPGSGRHQLWLTLGGAGQSRLWGVDIDEGQETEQAGRKWEVLLRDVPAIEEETAQLAAKAQADHLRWKLRGAMSQIDPAQATKLKIREQSGMSGAKFGPTWQRLVDAGEIRLASNSDPHMRQWEPRYRLVDLAECNDRDSAEFDPLDDTFLTMTTAELLGYAEKATPPSPDQHADQPSCSSSEAAEIAPRHDRLPTPENRSRESPLEKNSQASPVHSPRKARKRRAKVRRRRR
ncbi:AAA family ATPase [Blastopirellula sp. J2-11]|uniref:AAA family ATPase n=1 Tax=Blastopirellula sp. J2-11 TaxID=2943192 RepID=UPI0021C574A7|nr:AAA family ATPase [Blastopirellula sp. J2-11]UUO05188.1 AAA family ATPase [Blastopirellula sp. J2-11]